jgi:hypothetical protein
MGSGCRGAVSILGKRAIVPENVNHKKEERYQFEQ